MTRVWANFMALLLSVSHRNCAVAPFCPPTQRYDVAQFPPRCMDCPSIIPNQIQLTQISTVARTTRAIKFSPGLPQNQTCGCWRSPANQTIGLALNTSWIVSGLVFNSNRGRWLRQIRVQASADNATFIDWGTYTATNFSDAATTIFSYPIKAQFFRITVLRYANHFVNDSTGFPLSVQALVSQTQPFDCKCPRLSDGRCCPYVNMTVRNDTCMWCMDPTQMSTVMINGCGKCRFGTYEYQGRCLDRRPGNVKNSFQIANAETNGVFWTMNMTVTADPNTILLVYLTQSNQVHPCLSKQATVSCLEANKNVYLPILRIAMAQHPDPPLISNQHLQFDRGRYTLNMTQPTIRAWASCDKVSCTGYIGAVFVTLFETSATMKTQTTIQPLHFNLEMSNFVVALEGSQNTELAKVELHQFKDTWALRITGVKMRGVCVYVQWGWFNWLRYNNTEDDEYKPVDAPPNGEWDTVRVSDCARVTTLRVQKPMTIVTHDTTIGVRYSGIRIQITYGLNFSTTPLPGDSEQLVLITARSPQPIRLKRLAVVSLDQGITTTYTTSKGFIIDSSRVLDLTMACSQTPNALLLWITKAIWVLADSPPDVLTNFVKTSCALVTENRVSKAYWLIPARALTPRTAAYQMEVVVEFG